MATTIQLEKKTKDKLEKMKMFPRESYDHVIKRLLEREEDEVLSDKTIKNIEQALEDVKAGRVYSTKEVKRKLDI